MYRISELIQVDRKLFHTKDLALLWGIKNKNTLYKTISRYLENGVLFPVYKGLYATVPVETLDPIALGKAIIHRFAYLTTETVLAQNGIISQAVYDFTFAASISRRVTVGPWSFRYRQMMDEYLFNPVGIIEENGVFIATPERAAADMLYFNPKYHFDVSERIDFARVKSIQEEVGY